MGQVVQFTAPRTVDVVHESVGPPGPGQVLVRTRYSGISAGTELTAFRGTNPYLTRTWDAGRRVFTDGGATFAYPVRGWGYQEVGEVVSVVPGVVGLQPGALVWGVWGHRSEAVVDADRLTELPAGVEPLAGVFARLGAIAFNAVLDAGPLLGAHVVVFGQGVLGLLATRLAVLAGATVTAVEPLPRRRELAIEHGARYVLDSGPSSGGVAERVHELTGGRGADVCIEISGAYPALHEAIRTSGTGGRVVASGFYQGQATALRLGEEFHHNRVQLVASQISGVNPQLAPRWQPERLARSFMALVAEGRVDPLGLVTHLMDVGEAAKAFRLLDERPHEALQAVLRFPGEASPTDEPAIGELP